MGEKNSKRHMDTQQQAWEIWAVEIALELWQFQEYIIREYQEYDEKEGLCMNSAAWNRDVALVGC